MEKTVCELFAGVGGFRLGLENSSKDWKTVWFSQWEPSRKSQYAHDCYVSHFGDIDENTGIDIHEVDKSKLPDFNLLVGGFPCQDYSVACTGAKGIEGKKGVLWWQIVEVLKAKKPKFVLLENVDRLLKSPASLRGKDFGIMLSCFDMEGYYVEWRVVNASDYGAAQKRKRLFIFACRKDTRFFSGLKEDSQDILNHGFMGKAFPVEKSSEFESGKIPSCPDNNFSMKFLESGFMRNGQVFMKSVVPIKIPFIPLKDILEKDVDSKYFLSDDKIKKFEYLKGSKRIERVSKTGHHYAFSEGKMAFPDFLDMPARTMLTSEGTVNRSTHVVLDGGKLRLITPLEAERIQGFPDNWTLGMPEKSRYFCMGNALVVPMITRMGNVLNEIFEKE